MNKYGTIEGKGEERKTLVQKKPNRKETYMNTTIIFPGDEEEQLRLARERRNQLPRTPNVHPIEKNGVVEDVERARRTNAPLNGNRPFILLR